MVASTSSGAVFPPSTLTQTRYQAPQPAQNHIINPLSHNQKTLKRKQTISMPSLHTNLHQCQTTALPLVTTPVTNYSLSSISLNDQDILNITHSLNINKAHRYDISIRLLKICDSSIVRPLSIIFKNCLQIRSFPNNWKKSNVVPIHKNQTHVKIVQHTSEFLFDICWWTWKNKSLLKKKKI